MRFFVLSSKLDCSPNHSDFFHIDIDIEIDRDEVSESANKERKEGSAKERRIGF